MQRNRLDFYTDYNFAPKGALKDIIHEQFYLPIVIGKKVKTTSDNSVLCTSVLVCLINFYK